ncbi:MAG TPA: DNA-processing protein DprA [Polyangiaceae bacterium]|nr:DNA-processing protein DprA [Polyangiaceae bacterium]
MPAPVPLTPLDRAYPSRLRCLDDPPASLTTRGGPLEARHAVAVVGSRDADGRALRFAFDLARALARAEVVVVSGGAKGIDAAAHRGALDARGRTWSVAATGHEHCYPKTHAKLFETIGRGPGAMLWPFAPEYRHRTAFLSRNGVLVAMADAVVVVQAGPDSGALHAASCARRLRRPLWVVPVAPWSQEKDAFAGSLQLLGEGARALTSADVLLASLGIPVESATEPAEARLAAPAFRVESKLLSVISNVPQHVDALSAQAGQTVQAVTAEVLTLALENVVVEGPPGFFRRRESV